ALARELPVRPRERVLWLRSELADAALADELRARDAVVDDVVAYRVVPRAEPAPELRARLIAGEIDAVVLASPSAVQGFVNATREPDSHRRGGVRGVQVSTGRKDSADPAIYSRTRIVSIGPTTSAAIR